MDLVRTILLRLEECEDPLEQSRGSGLDSFDGFTPTQVSYHTKLLEDPRLIEAADTGVFRPSGKLQPTRPTWAGHEFLEASRRDTIWQKAKGIVLEKTGGLSLDVLKAVLMKLALDAAMEN